MTVTRRRKRGSELRGMNNDIGLDSIVFSRCSRANALCQCYLELLVHGCERKDCCTHPSAFAISPSKRAMEATTLRLFRLMKK